MKRREFLLSLSALALIPAIGCNGGKKSPLGVVKLGGVATYNGQPLPKGTMLNFTPASNQGRQSGAVVGDNGEFYCKYTGAEDGVQKGELQVAAGWDDETNGPIPSGYEDFFKRFNDKEGSLTITIEKADTNYALEF